MPSASAIPRWWEAVITGERELSFTLVCYALLKWANST